MAAMMADASCLRQPDRHGLKNINENSPIAKRHGARTVPAVFREGEVDGVSLLSRNDAESDCMFPDNLLFGATPSLR
jgi:hypothetical protein